MPRPGVEAEMRLRRGENRSRVCAVCSYRNAHRGTPGLD